MALDEAAAEEEMVTQAVLDRVRAAALERWQATGLRPEQVATEIVTAASSSDSSQSADGNHGIGVVQSIDRENVVVQIDHGDIEGVMPSMNMPYNVKDKSLLDSIAVGDTIDFWVERTPSGLVVTRLAKR